MWVRPHWDCYCHLFRQEFGNSIHRRRRWIFYLGADKHWRVLSSNKSYTSTITLLLTPDWVAVKPSNNRNLGRVLSSSSRLPLSTEYQLKYETVRATSCTAKNKKMAWLYNWSIGAWNCSMIAWGWYCSMRTCNCSILHENVELFHKIPEQSF